MFFTILQSFAILATLLSSLGSADAILSGHLDLLILIATDNTTGLPLTIPAVQNDVFSSALSREKYTEDSLKPAVLQDQWLEQVKKRLTIIEATATEAANTIGFDAYLTPHLIAPIRFRFPDDDTVGDMDSHSIKNLIFHVQMSVYNARQRVSKLSAPEYTGVMEATGMSSTMGRHLMNNLCSAMNTRYLEVGVWRGSTFIAASAGNEYNMVQTTAIDLWSWDQVETAELTIELAQEVFGESEDAYQHSLRSMERYLLPAFVSSIDILRADCFEVDIDLLLARNGGRRFTTYFYDAGHTAEDHKRAFTHYDRALADVFIAVVDDWNYSNVPLGTKSAFEELGYKVLYGEVLGFGHALNLENLMFHNGMYVAVVQKLSE